MTCHLCKEPVIDGNNILESHLKYELKRNGQNIIAVCTPCDFRFQLSDDFKKYRLTDIKLKPRRI